MGKTYTGSLPVQSFQGKRALTTQSYTEANSKLGFQHEGELDFPLPKGTY